MELRSTAADEYLRTLAPFLKRGIVLAGEEGLPTAPMPQRSAGTEANAYYFGQPTWMESWLKYVHRYPELCSRWHATSVAWKVVVDVGCGPGNLFATLGGVPTTLIGVDVAKASLHMAKELGYTPLLADAHDLPLRSEFADIVAVNGSIHHMDNMSDAMRECARLVRPG